MLAPVCADAAPPAVGAGIARWVEQIESSRPGVIFVGSSIQGEGIDFPELSRALGASVLDARSGGSLSPWHYCFLRFVLPAADHRAKLVVVETRLNYLSCPQRRMHSPVYRRAVEAIAGQDRALLERLAYSSEGRPDWDLAYEQDPGPPYDSFYWDFDASVEHSFLPEMIRLAEEGGYQLVIAAHKTRRHADEPGWEPPAVRKYGRQMAAYLQAKGVPFLDYTARAEIGPEHYGNGDHLGRDTGRPILTGLVLEDLRAILAGQKAPNQRDPATQPATATPAPTAAGAE